MRIVGLTGGIAAGKTAVAAALAAAGLPVIDCDVLAHESAAPGAWGYRRIIAALGPAVTVGGAGPPAPLDRAAIGRIAFTDPAARRALNGATHLPIAAALVGRLVRSWLACAPVVVVDMPLLFESGAWVATRPRVLVDAPVELRTSRLRERDGLTQAEAEARVAAQAPAAGKRARCQFVVDNDGSRAELEVEAASLAAALKRGAWVHALVSPPAVVVAVAVVAVVCGRRGWW